jgi:hypothetical protein
MAREPIVGWLFAATSGILLCTWMEVRVGGFQKLGIIVVAIPSAFGSIGALAGLVVTLLRARKRNLG